MNGLLLAPSRSSTPYSLDRQKTWDFGHCLKKRNCVTVKALVRNSCWSSVSLMWPSRPLKGHDHRSLWDPLYRSSTWVSKPTGCHSQVHKAKWLLYHSASSIKTAWNGLSVRGLSGVIRVKAPFRIRHHCNHFCFNYCLICFAYSVAIYRTSPQNQFSLFWQNSIKIKSTNASKTKKAS